MKPALLLLALATASHAQGPLTPPSGIPAPVMKTLDQIEPRTPIPPSPSTPIAGPHFTITQPGSYYLTGNVTLASGSGIIISSDEVTLDLNGFTIRSLQVGASVDAAAAVFVTGAPRRQISVKNGFVRSGSLISGQTIQANGFSTGINLGETQDTATISGVDVVGVTFTAIFVDGKGIVENCRVSNSGNGITAGTITNCRIDQCLDRGFDGDIITNCFARSVKGEAIFSRGIVTNCHAISENGASAINCPGTVSFSRARRDGGIAIQAGIAVACTVAGTGTISSPQKHLGTP